MSEKLRQARKARGWSQERLVREIERHARQHVLDVASTASLRVYVSEWENGRRTVSSRYAAVLRALLGMTDRELFKEEPRPLAAAPVDGYEELISRVDSARSVSLTMVDTFMNQTELLRSMDRQMGAASLVDQMAGHLAALEEALTFAVLPGTRRPIARALAGAATLAAWQALDAGAVDRAWRNYELGKRAAQEADEPMYLAHAKGEQAYVLADAGRPELGVELIRDARQAGGTRLSPRLTAWLYAAEAELCARAGRPDECRQALDAAAAVLPGGEEARDSDMPSIFLNRAHLARWRGNALVLLGNDDAVTASYDALAAMDPTFVRAASGLRCDLAQAHLVRGEHEEARTHLQQARLLANRTGSVRHRRRIEQLTGEL
ncbi:XRE family transcriptional regulator [Streptomyces sp. SCUT-3]|uniref:helix-turn-helix domain-containing protein n=1 Tax=Streptomyces sp. SCUT-3 TaxID=2684469 RepID=UPI000CAB6385|nr:helix-turn-helix transcriptional regulator [Streptomyces sp. SCUT-3]PLW72252.1 regulator [Streptomyces sp. DJ]QMV23351.1 XRE family transcriptional regulator [Streptomyces sp. SCUT-3]